MDHSMEAGEKLAAMSRQLSGMLDKQAVIELVCRDARELVRCDGACFILREGEFVHYSQEETVAPLWAGQRFPITNCISGWAILHRAPVVIEDIYHDKRIPIEYYRNTFVKSLAMMPIQQDNPTGAIGVYWARQHRATEQELILLETLAGLVAVAFVNVQLFDQVVAARLEAEAKEEFRSLFELTAIGLAQAIIPTGKFLHVNRKFCEITGYSEAELLAMSFLDITHPDDRERNIADLDRLVMGETDEFSLVKRYIRKDGQVVWARVTSRFIRGERGRPSRAVAAVEDITSRKKAEEALRESEERLNAVMQNTNALIYVMDRDSRFVHVNRRFEQLFNLKANVLRGKSVHDVFAKEFADTFAANNQRVLQSLQPLEAEETAPHEDGLHTYISLKVPQFDAAGNACGVIGISTDITERKRAEEQLLQQAAILNQMSEAVNVTDDQGYLLYTNPGFERMFGYEPGELLGEHVSRLNAYPPDENRRKVEEILNALETEGTWHGEIMNRRKDGSRFISYGSVVSQRVGSTTRFVSVQSDITERRLAEENLRRSEERFRQAADASNALVYEVDLLNGQTTVVYGLEKVLGYDPHTTDTTRNWWQSLIHPEDLPGHLEQSARNLQHGRLYRSEYRVRHADGNYRFVEDYGKAIQNKEGRAMRLVGAITDITSRKEFERAREQLLIREHQARNLAEEANLAKDRFLGMLSHELRSPLNAMYGWTQILLRNEPNQTTTRQGLEVIDRNIRLQNTLIEDLLDVSRIISGKMRIESEPMSLVSLLHMALETALPAAEKRQIRIESSVDIEADHVHADQHRLQQVVNNLLTNALKFTPGGGLIKVTLQRAGDTAKLTVQDSGIGIAPDFLPHIFDRFRQAETGSKRAYGGLGLGLTIVKYLVELHGGSVIASSEGKNEGATFTVTLPLISPALSHADLKTAHGEQEWRDQGAKALSGLRILLVDDDRDALDIIRLILEAQDATVTCLSSAGMALQELQNQPYDMLISAVGMPEMDGLDLIGKVRESMDIKKLPAIALTGYASADERERILRAGYQAHLPKPVELQDLILVIIGLVKNGGGRALTRP